MDGIKTLVMYNLPVETRCYLPCVFSSSFCIDLLKLLNSALCCNLATFMLAFCCIQGSYPFSETSFQDFSRTFPELRLIFQGSKIHINPYTHKISMLILLTVFHTLRTFLVEFNRFPELSRTSAIFPGLSRFSRTRTNPVHNCMWY